MVGGIIFIVVILLFYGWILFTPSGRSAAAESRRRRVAKRAEKNRTISSVGERTSGGLACPKCGGTQYKVRRRTSTKVALGAASLLGQAKHVRCVTCGSEYRRG